jgi:hypothetical protein
MKTLQEILNESLSVHDLKDLTKVLKRFRKLDQNKIEDKLFDGDTMKKPVIKILDKYDEYAEDILWMAINVQDIDETAYEIKRAADENEVRTGTESVMIIYMLEEIADFLKI